MEPYDIVVIGGGPGGYTAAVRCAQLGMKTALVEKESLGGTCLNWGCIPTKSLLRNAEVVHLLSKGKTFGFAFDNLSVDYAVAHKRSRQVAQRQSRRLNVLMKNNGISVHQGTARLKTARQVLVEPSGDVISAEHIIIATGAKARSLPGTDFDGKRIINFRSALDLTTLLESAVIIGAGPIGMEFATIWNRYGAKVTVVEMMPHALPMEDEDICIEAEKQFRRNGIALKTGTMVQQVTASAEGVVVTVSKEDVTEEISTQTVLVSIGFAANYHGLGLEQLGIATERGNVVVDDRMRTSVPNIYAIGDVNGKMGLAHVAAAQGVIAAEAIAGKPTATLIYSDIPRCTYAQPEIASVGLTEKQARQLGHDVITSLSPFIANGKAMAMDDNTGFVKLVADRKTKKVLGAHLIGGHVTELIAGPAGMVTLESSFEDFGRIINPHPTLSEAVMEAAHALCGHAIHL